MGDGLSFERDIRPLFRDSDVDSMDWAFDLVSHADVAAHAETILERLEEGTMPCDASWPDAQVSLFRDWVEAGSPP